jgi:hypothetical protein
MPLALNRFGFFFGLEKRALMYLYSNDLFGYQPPAMLLTIAIVILSPLVIIAPSAAMGLALTRLRPDTILLYILLFAYITPHVLILSEDRFHLAVLPFFAILASQAWAGGLEAFRIRWQESNIGKVAVGFGIFIAILFFINWGLELYHDADKIAALLAPGGNQTHFPY